MPTLQNAAHRRHKMWRNKHSQTDAGPGEFRRKLLVRFTLRNTMRNHASAYMKLK